MNLGIHESGGGGFDPTSISGLKLWLKADSFSGADGDPVGTWTDSSGSGNSATSSGSNRPTYKTNILNGLPVIRFTSASSHYMVTPSISWTHQTIFIVIKGTGTGYPSAFTSGSENGIIYNFTANKLEIYNGPRIDIGDFSSFAYATIKREASTATTVRRNGTQTGTNATVNIPGSGAVRIGSHFAGDFFPGDIAEYLIYDAALGTTDIEDVEAYLADKYAL